MKNRASSLAQHGDLADSPFDTICSILVSSGLNFTSSRDPEFTTLIVSSAVEDVDAAKALWKSWMHHAAERPITSKFRKNLKSQPKMHFSKLCLKSFFRILFFYQKKINIKIIFKLKVQKSNFRAPGGRDWGVRVEGRCGWERSRWELSVGSRWGSTFRVFFPFPTFSIFSGFSWTCVGGLGVLLSQNGANPTPSPGV